VLLLTAEINQYKTELVEKASLIKEYQDRLATKDK
jgi:hypothetical protein